MKLFDHESGHIMPYDIRTVDSTCLLYVRIRKLQPPFGQTKKQRRKVLFVLSNGGWFLSKLWITKKVIFWTTGKSRKHVTSRDASFKKYDTGTVYPPNDCLRTPLSNDWPRLFWDLVIFCIFSHFFRFFCVYIRVVYTAFSVYALYTPINHIYPPLERLASPFLDGGSRGQSLGGYTVTLWWVKNVNFSDTVCQVKNKNARYFSVSIKRLGMELINPSNASSYTCNTFEKLFSRRYWWISLENTKNARFQKIRYE